MNDQINDGGPAFPAPAVYDPSREQINSASAYTGESGISMRDYFAASALQGLIAEPFSEGHYSTAYVIGGGHTDPATNFARAAYLLADAMLKARKA